MRVIPPRRICAYAALLSSLVLSLSCGGDDGGSPSPTPTDLVVTPGSDTLLALGETQLFVATVLDESGDPIDGATVTWSSTSPAVVSVDPLTGLATALTNGSAQIQATSGALHGTSPVLVAQVPTTVTITPGTATFTFVGDTQTFTATVLDAGGAPVAPVQRIWTINDNTVAVIDSVGHARAKGAGVAMVTVVAIGPGGAKGGYAAITATQPVASLHIRNQPTGTIAGEALAPALQVEVLDSGGAVVTGFAGLITVGIDSGPAGGVLRGTKAVNAIGGVSSFSGLSLERAGLHILGATATDLAPDESAPITVVAAAAHHLAFVTQPTSVVAGAPIPLVTVIADRFENRIIDSAKAVTLFLESGPVGETLHGDPAGDHHPDGTITFPGAHLEVSSIGYVLRVSAVGLIGNETISFSVGHADPYRIRMTGDSGFRVGGPATAPVVTIRIEDLYGNTTFGDTADVSLASSWPFSAPIGRGQIVTPATPLQVVGQRTVTDIYFSRPGPTALIASSPGLISDTSTSYPVHFPGAFGSFLGPTETCLDTHYCVGANDHGQLGIDPAALTTDSVFIAHDSTMFDYVSLGFGTDFACGVDLVPPSFSYIVKCRGANDEGQLGRGSAGPDDASFVRITGATGWWTVAMGTAHACALTADSTAVCWGRNDQGQLGRGSVTPFEATPAAVNGGVKFKLIQAGGDHTCGITTTNGIRCWGANSSGQLGDSTLVDASAPVAVVGANVWVELALGQEFTCAVKTNVGRKALCWGDNSTGQLGDPGAGVGRNYPELVSGGLNDIPTGLVAGSAHVCMVANSALVCWGDDSRGQVGNGGGTGTVTAPVGVSFPGGWAAGSPSAGGQHSCAIGFNASNFPHSQVLFCWGANDRGQLGTGNTLDQTGPAEAVQ